MRIVIDSNIAISAILNSNGRIARIILQPKSQINLYSTNQLIEEIEEHKDKLRQVSNYSENELDLAISLITSRIRFINVRLIPKEIYLKSEQLTEDVDIDDTEFIALAEHAKAKLWSGDKKLIKGLTLKRWNKFISTDDLFKIISKRK